MTALFLLSLAAAWAVVFLTAASKAGRRSPLSSTETFKRGMSVMAPGGQRGLRGRWVLFPDREDRRKRAQERRGLILRRRVFALLVAGSVISLPVAAFLGGDAWWVHLGFVASLALFASYLRERKRRRQERLSKVRRLSGGRDHDSKQREAARVRA